MTRRKVIIDTDPGIDDAFALVSAMAAQDIELLALTTVAGNKGLDAVTKNALRLKQLMNSDVDIYAGRESQISEQLDASEFHGNDGMGNSGLPYDMSLLKSETASDFILETVKSCPGEIDLLTLGPLTNISQAIKKDPKTMKKLRSIYMMGGGLNRGNVTPYAEFNFYFDAEATAEVIKELAADVDIHIMTLDASHKTLLTVQEMEWYAEKGGELGKVLNHIFQPYRASYKRANGYEGAVIHDLLLVLYYLNPDLSLNTSEEKLSIITEGEKRGQTVLDEGGSKVKLILDLNDTDWKEQFTELVFPEVQ